MNNRVVSWLIKNEQFNAHLVNYQKSNELQKQFVQYLPDRYTANYSLYNKQTGFFEYNDIKKWTAGFYENNVGDLSRFLALNLCIDQLLEECIVGDIAEFGVFKGNSAFLLARFAQRINTNCYLFDTFEGFDERDFKENKETRFEQDFSGTSLSSVKEFVGEENVVYVKGFFPDSLAQIKEVEGLALVHIDCDLGAPFKAALDYFYPRLQKGGFLIMHDYTSLFWPGAKKAIDEYFKDKPEFLIPIPDKSGTCIIRKV
ncbi:TylF/MycF/NovP-related O-methyltransferase [Mucilaginibacter glaciei]|nr:TylF/MycF/NovP-related O-methyltransferase [Mucilaginibacter glaciei]